MKRKVLMRALGMVVTLFFLTTQSINAQVRGAPEPSSQQPTEPLPATIGEDTKLEPGTYLVQNNVKVKKKATLTIPAGSKLIFQNGTTLRVEGGLNINGSVNNRVTVSSKNEKDLGMGIVIAGVSDTDRINITYARFTNLIVPLNFKSFWYRPGVNISNNVFTGITTGEPGILIRTPKKDILKKRVKFTFTKNNFTENTSGILIERLNGEMIGLNFRHNLINANKLKGSFSDRYGIYNNPIYMIQKKQQGEKSPLTINENSIFGNYVIDRVTDTVVKEQNMGILGFGEELSLPNNYFGKQSKEKVEKTFDHFLNNPSAPYLNPSSLLSAPPPAVHGHIWQGRIDTAQLSMTNKIPDIKKKTFKMVLKFNRSVAIAKEEGLIQYTYFDLRTKQVRKKTISEFTPGWLSGNKQLNLTINDPVVSKTPLGYFTIEGFKDDEGFDVPVFEPGKSFFLAHYRDPEYYEQLAMKEEEKEEKPEKEAETKASPTYKKWEAGLNLGLSFYYGDLTYNNVLPILQVHPAIGLRGKYYLSQKLDIGAHLNYGQISGSDDGSRNDGRDLQFFSPLLNLSFMLEYELFRIRISGNSNFAPVIGTGFSVFNFNPKRKLGGKTYELHSLWPSGNRYSKTQLALPGLLDFQLRLSDWTAGIGLHWNKEFTDLIDDVGGRAYPTRAELGGDQTAFKLLSPAERTGGVRGNPDRKDWYSFINLSLTKKF